MRITLLSVCTHAETFQQSHILTCQYILLLYWNRSSFFFTPQMAWAMCTQYVHGMARIWLWVKENYENAGFTCTHCMTSGQSCFINECLWKMFKLHALSIIMRWCSYKSGWPFGWLLVFHPILWITQLTNAAFLKSGDAGHVPCCARCMACSNIYIW